MFLLTVGSSVAVFVSDSGEIWQLVDFGSERGQEV